MLCPQSKMNKAARLDRKGNIIVFVMSSSVFLFFFGILCKKAEIQGSQLKKGGGLSGKQSNLVIKDTLDPAKVDFRYFDQKNKECLQGEIRNEKIDRHADGISRFCRNGSECVLLQQQRVVRRKIHQSRQHDLLLQQQRIISRKVDHHRQYDLSLQQQRVIGRKDQLERQYRLSLQQQRVVRRPVQFERQ